MDARESGLTYDLFVRVPDSPIRMHAGYGRAITSQARPPCFLPLTIGNALSSADNLSLTSWVGSCQHTFLAGSQCYSKIHISFSRPRKHLCHETGIPSLDSAPG